MNDDHNHHRDTNEERYAKQREMLSHHRLRVWDKARQFVRLVSKNPIGDAELRNQASRAVKSVGCNIAEGAALEGASRKKHYKIAKGSAVEAVAAYDLLLARGHECATTAAHPLRVGVLGVERSPLADFGQTSATGAGRAGAGWSAWLSRRILSRCERRSTARTLARARNRLAHPLAE